MRFGIASIVALSVFATLSLAQDSQWALYDDLILRNVWKSVLGSFMGIVIQLGCSQGLPQLGSTMGYASFVGFLGADEAAVEANFGTMAANADVCVEYANLWWEQIWHTKGKKPFIFDTSDYIN